MKTYLEGAYKSPYALSTYPHMPLSTLFDAALWTVDDLVHHIKIFQLKGTKHPIKSGLNYKDIFISCEKSGGRIAPG